MKKHISREIAKFLAGVIAADLLVLWWLVAEKMLPVRVLGVAWTTEAVAPGIAFDIALILILIYYGWNVGRIPAFRERAYLFITGSIFTLSALAHVARLFFNHVNVVVVGWTVPLSPSWLMLIISAYLAFLSFNLMRHRR